jgi:hypothetical protein
MRKETPMKILIIVIVAIGLLPVGAHSGALDDALKVGARIERERAITLRYTDREIAQSAKAEIKQHDKSYVEGFCDGLDASHVYDNHILLAGKRSVTFAINKVTFDCGEFHP